MDVVVSDAAWSDMRRIGLAIAKVQILHILHGAMDYEAILFPEG